MMTQITVPELGESVTEATVAKWLKSVGDEIAIDDPLVELETDKVTLEVYAQAAGTLTEIEAEEGSEIEIGGVLGVIAEGVGKGGPRRQARGIAAPKPEAVPEAAPRPGGPKPHPAPRLPAAAQLLSPAVRKLVDEHRLNPAAIPASGKNGRLTKADVLAFITDHKGAQAATPAPEPAPAPEPTPAPAPAPAPAAPPVLRDVEAPREERVRMTRLRKRIAERLKEAQNTAAMLTTFNEVDMTNVLAMRNQYREQFEAKHGARLGFMSFFIKAAIVALKEIPTVNAEIDGDEIVYKNHYDIGVAVGTPQGLVVPVVRDADRLSFAELEARIGELAKKARDGRLELEDLSGGTFTITNGGVYGSLMSTPILNPPQSGILGMHKIQKRPVAVGDGIEIRPMMYLALSYDHRIVDGREAVTFLVRLKECIEEPQRILLDI
ncbi:MAG: 2-oxoglutarate dehydrogenase complex dihydrolipoyllysine-residue succinyltransferase [Alphaproteobacteria bacterium]